MWSVCDWFLALQSHCLKHLNFISKWNIPIHIKVQCVLLLACSWAGVYAAVNPGTCGICVMAHTAPHNFSSRPRLKQIPLTDGKGHELQYTVCVWCWCCVYVWPSAPGVIHKTFITLAAHFITLYRSWRLLNCSNLSHTDYTSKDTFTHPNMCRTFTPGFPSYLSHRTILRTRQVTLLWPSGSILKSKQFKHNVSNTHTFSLIPQYLPSNIQKLINPLSPAPWTCNMLLIGCLHQVQISLLITLWFWQSAHTPPLFSKNIFIKISFRVQHCHSLLSERLPVFSAL